MSEQAPISFEASDKPSVRVTVIDNVKYLSVRDIIMCACDASSKLANQKWNNFSDDLKQDLSEHIKLFQFSGQGQLVQTVISFEGGKKLIMFLSGKINATNRSAMLSFLQKYDTSAVPALSDKIDAPVDPALPGSIDVADDWRRHDENTPSNARKGDQGKQLSTGTSVEAKSRVCVRCTLTRVTGDRTECRACANDTYKNKGFEWQVRKFLEEHDDLMHFTYTDTALPCASKNASNVRRADFTYVLQDRVVFLEVDENEHRYNSPDCERKREQQLADSVTKGKYVIIVRYCPMVKGILWMENLERLAKALRDAFITQEVKLADDGIHRVYVGYQMATIRKLDAAYEEVQKGALKRAREITDFFKKK